MPVPRLNAKDKRCRNQAQPLAKGRFEVGSISLTYLDSLTAEQWGGSDHLHQPAGSSVHNPGNGHYIEKVPHAIDEGYIKARHGGGRYLVFVKNVRTKGRERSKIVVIEGAPKLVETQTMVDPRTKQPRASPKAGPGHDEGTIADVLTKAIQSQKVPAEEAIKAAMETLGAAQKAALDVVLNAATAQAEVVHELLLGQLTAAGRWIGARRSTVQSCGA